MLPDLPMVGFYAYQRLLAGRSEPVSYGDPRHHGRLFASVEAAFVVFAVVMWLELD